jgi:hypothetical protein
MTPAEAAALLGVNPKVLERWRGTGGGTAYARLSSKTIRYRREDVDAFVAARVRASTAAAGSLAGRGRAGPARQADVIRMLPGERSREPTGPAPERGLLLWRPQR